MQCASLNNAIFLSQFLFEKMGGQSEEAKKSADAIPFVAEILRLTDPTMMSLELGTLINNFPDITKDHLIGILYLRSDVKVNIFPFDRCTSVNSREQTCNSLVL